MTNESIEKPDVPQRTMEERISALEELLVLKELSTQHTMRAEQMGNNAPAAIVLTALYITRSFLASLHQLVAYTGIRTMHDEEWQSYLPLVMQFAEGIEKTVEAMERRISLQEEAAGKQQAAKPAEQKSSGLVGADGRPLGG